MVIRPILITHCTDFNSKCSYCGNIGHLTQVCHSRLLENATKFQRSSQEFAPVLRQPSQDVHSDNNICLATTIKQNKVLMNAVGQNVRALLDTSSIISVMNLNFLIKTSYI